MKKVKPVVKLPKHVIIRSMLGSSKGKVDRKYLRMMAEAIHSSERHKNDNMKKMYKDTSEVES